MARAQERDPLERGLALADEADFERAWQALEEADGSPLDRDARVSLYSTRAMVAFALGREADARADLARLLAMGANASLPDTAPPQLREALEQLRREGVRPPTLLARASVEDGVARIEASAEGGADLVRGVRVWVHDGAWRAFPRVERPLGADETLRWYAEVVGPGDVRLTAEGTPEQPNLLHVHVEDVVLRRAPDAETGDDGAWWAALGGGAAAIVVGAAIAIGVVFGAPSDSTRLTGPTLER